ncbi:hypothetical protein HY311_02625 [Candidatus Nomurabacteria bacterium]|nr:hypothetical protein [Candidatus Nomurabacteria bacterium]
MKYLLVAVVVFVAMVLLDQYWKFADRRAIRKGAKAAQRAERQRIALLRGYTYTPKKSGRRTVDKVFIFLFHSVGIVTICYGYTSHSKSLFEMGLFGGLAIIGSAQWLWIVSRRP